MISDLEFIKGGPECSKIDNFSLIQSPHFPFVGLKKMKRDMKEMRDSEKTLTPADKTTNLYRLTKEQYDQLSTYVRYVPIKQNCTKIQQK